METFFATYAQAKADIPEQSRAFIAVMVAYAHAKAGAPQRALTLIQEASGATEGGLGEYTAAVAACAREWSEPRCDPEEPAPRKRR